MAVDVSSVSAATSSTQLIAAKAARSGAAVYNDSTDTLYILFGDGTASTSNFTVQVASEALYEIPVHFNGQVKGIWSGTNGAARVTEWY